MSHFASVLEEIAAKTRRSYGLRNALAKALAIAESF